MKRCENKTDACPIKHRLDLELKNGKLIEKKALNLTIIRHTFQSH